MTDPQEPKAIGGQVARPLHVFAEPDPGCSLFIPRLGNRERSEAIRKKAMEWFGREVTS